jgi:hypothetical protein
MIDDPFLAPSKATQLFTNRNLLGRLTQDFEQLIVRST